MDNSLGQKIKNFRKRAGKSQFDLELDIEASPGSISRIESGEVNPTKETLMKIVECLNLNELEQSSLFNIGNKFSVNVLENINELIVAGDSEDLLNKATSMFIKELNLLAIIVCLIDGEFIKAKALTSQWYTPIINGIIGTDFKNLRFRFESEEFKKNSMYKVIREGKELLSDKLEDFACPPLSVSVSRTLATFTGNKANICFPIPGQNKILGTILFTKNVKDDFQTEREVLREFTKVLGYKYSTLKI